MNCPKCGKENDDNSNYCSNCSAKLQAESLATKPKKPIHKKWWFWVIAVFVVIVALSTSVNDKTDAKDNNQPVETPNTSETSNNALNSEQPSATDTADNSANLTTGQKNALKKAKSYLEMSAFSYNGLIEQLEYEGFTHEQAVFGAEANGY